VLQPAQALVVAAAASSLLVFLVAAVWLALVVVPWTGLEFGMQ